MALLNSSALLFNYHVTELNRSIDFKKVSMGTELKATMRIGYYSLTALLIEWKRAMEEVDPDNTYTASVDRTISGGTQNRVTLSTAGPYLEILIATGLRSASSFYSLFGFPYADLNGNITYTANSSSGTMLITTFPPWRYTSPSRKKKIQGSVNIAASGSKEAIVWGTQSFGECEYMHEPEAKIDAEWIPFMDWAINQQSFEWTPDIGSPTTFYECSLEKTSEDGKGLAYELKEMIPDFPKFYTTQALTFRVIERT